MTGAIDSVDARDVVNEAMEDYSSELILNRAFPNVYDGLKPVQRFILWQAFDSNLTPTRPHMKLAKLSGLCMTYHPHGDMSIDSAAVVMSQEWKCRAPLMDIHGNNGTIGGDPAAASRYIEARLSNMGATMFDGVREDAVDFVDNFDATARHPVVLPAAYPIAAIEGTSGIGVGLRTSIVPHNPAEILSLMELELMGDLSVETAKTVYGGPDFPTGGKFYGRRFAELTGGEASYVSVGDVSVGKNCIVVSSVPYGVSTRDVTKSIVDIVEKKNLSYVTQVLDNTTELDVNIIVKCSRATSPKTLAGLAKLIESKSKVSARVHAQNNMVVDGKVRCLSLIDYMRIFVDFRLETVRRFSAHRLAATLDKIDRETARLVGCESGARVGDIVSRHEGDDGAVVELCEAFDVLSERAAGYVCALSVRDLMYSPSRAERIRETIAKLKGRAGELDRLVNDVQVRREWVLEQVREARKVLGADYPRLSEWGGDTHAVDVSQVDSVALEAGAQGVTPVWVAFSRSGMGIQKSNKKLDLDPAEWIVLLMNSNDVVCAFTRSGKFLRRRVSRIDMGLTQANRFVNKLVSADSFIDACVFDPDLSMVSFTKFGYGKRMSFAKIMGDTLTGRSECYAKDFTTCKNGEDSVLATVIYKDQGLESVRVVVDGKRGERSYDVDAGALLSRDDSGKSNGSRVFNTNRGKDRVLSIFVDDVSLSLAN